MKKAIRLAVIIIAAAVFVFYAYKLVSYLAFSEMNRKENEELVLAAVTVNADFQEMDDDGGPMAVPDGSLPSSDDTESDTPNGGTGSLPSSDDTESSTPNGGAESLSSSDGTESDPPNGSSGSEPPGNPARIRAKSADRTHRYR